jgi:hypothetical protein
MQEVARPTEFPLGVWFVQNSSCGSPMDDFFSALSHEVVLHSKDGSASPCPGTSFQGCLLFPQMRRLIRVSLKASETRPVSAGYRRPGCRSAAVQATGPIRIGSLTCTRILSPWRRDHFTVPRLLDLSTRYRLSDRRFASWSRSLSDVPPFLSMMARREASQSVIAAECGSRESPRRIHFRTRAVCSFQLF